MTGSSVNFTWSFSGGSDGVFGVPWGIKRDDGIGFINNGVLVSLNPSRSPASFPIALTQEYSGRVGGRLTRNKFSGQAIFTLTSIRKTDETHYGCNLSPINDFEPTGFDNLYLLVEGKQLGALRYSIYCYICLTQQDKIGKEERIFQGKAVDFPMIYFLNAIQCESSQKVQVAIRFDICTSGIVRKQIEPLISGFTCFYMLVFPI